MRSARARRSSVARLGQGAFAGASCGFAVGTVQTLWLDALDVVALGAPLVLWAAGVAALVFGLAGALMALGLGGLDAVVQRRSGRSLLGLESGALVLGASFVLAAITVGRWRYYLDESLLVGDSPTSRLTIGLLALLVGALVGGAAAGLAAVFGLARTCAVFVATSLVITSAYEAWEPEPSTTERVADAQASRPTETASDALAPKRPHVILIVADSLRADALARFAPPGWPTAPTPALDRLARESAIVDRACAQSSWTKPGFASILSGLPPQIHTAARQIARLPDRITTLPELFRDAGYFTLGHSNANPNNSSAAHFEQGFDEFLDLPPPRRRLFAPEGATQLALYQRLIEPVAAALFGYDARLFYEPADLYTDRILARLRTLPTPSLRPLFLMLHFMDPHYPYMNGLRRGRPILLGSEVHRSRGPALASSLRGAYLGDVAFMDRHLGRLFAGLRELGLYDESVVVFTSDHGEELFEHQAWGHGESLYREVVEIPLLIKAPRSAARPDRGPADARPSEGARQIDIAPTLLDLASMPIPTGMQGLALLRDPGGESPPRRDVCHSSLDRTYNRLESLRTPTTTYILATRTNQPRIEPVELYDRKADPEERTNRAATAMALRRTLDAQLERIRAAWPAAASEGETMQLDRELEAQMRALGYHDPRD